jgi:hypothetical protein
MESSAFSNNKQNSSELAILYAKARNL